MWNQASTFSLSIFGLLALFIQAGCTDTGLKDTTVRPDLTPWFNAQTCEFSKRASVERKLADSLGRFCQSSPPKTETVMVAQRDAQSIIMTTECDFADTQQCELTATFCVETDGTGWCEFDKCYCEWVVEE